MPHPPAIALEKVGKSYDGGRSFAIRDVDLVAPRGAFVAIVGGSGSGKTTTLKTINRLVEPTSGAVRLEGQDVRGAQAADLRRRIGYVFQGIGLFPHMNVGENIAITPRLMGWDKPRRAARVAELLDLVDLPRDYAARAPDSLSGGQRQRVGVARALAASPSIMLLDEPFGALDPVTRDALCRAYRALHDRLGLTTLMVTHDVMEAIILADRIVVMDAGRIIADGAPGELMAGHADPKVSALMETPRRQAEAVRAVMDRAAQDG
jgi:osmoprotectant transport system ATP-binding protein